MVPQTAETGTALPKSVTTLRAAISEAAGDPARCRDAYGLASDALVSRFKAGESASVLVRERSQLMLSLIHI